MPLLKGKLLAPAKPLVNMGPTDVVYVIPHTSEQFLCKEEFEKRQALYKEPVWTCQSTGVTKLTHKEAMESEKRIRRLLEAEFPHVFEKQILELVLHSTCSLEGLVDEAWRNLHEFFTIGEYVTLKVKAHGKIMRGAIVKIEPTVADKVAEDDQSLSTSPKDTDSPKKAPKLCPCKYGVRIDGEDKIINSIPAGELVREAKLPKKDMIRFFIRTHAMRSGHQPSSQWVVSEQMVSKHLLQGKPCAVLGSLPERPDNQLKENMKKSKKRLAKGHADENCKPSKKRKLDLSEKHEKKTKSKPISSIQRTINLVASPSGKNLKTGLESNASQAAKDLCLPEDRDDTKVLKTPGKITAFVNGLKRSDSVSSSASSSEVPLAKLKGKSLDEDAPSTTNPIKQSLYTGSGKKKSAIESPQKQKLSADADSAKIATTKNFLDDDDSSFDMPLAKLRDISRASGASEPVCSAKKSFPETKKSKSALGKVKGSGMKSSSVILYRLASPKSSSKKNDMSVSPKKRLKQMTLFDMKGGRKDDNDKTPRKTPEKIPDLSPKKPVKKIPQEVQKKTPLNSSAKKSSPKSSEKTPLNGTSRTLKETPKKPSDSSIVKKAVTPVKPTPRKSLPPIVQRLQKANKETNTHLYRMLLCRCARELTDHQIRTLPEDLRAIILPKFNQLKEKKRLEQMTPAEREAHMLKKKEELRQHLKKKFAESRRRYEDTELDLRPLPSPKIVPTPDGLANELFGDVAMVAEFISCFRGLLMPSDSNSITSEKLMAALVAGKEGFTYLSNILCILLQTLLQDKLAEDYKELRVPLSEIPVSEYTASEMVRLCLRRFDADADSVDGSNSGDDEEAKQPEDNDVSEELIEQLESNEFYELDVEAKVQILVGLCNRIVGTYSVQDYMDEKQHEAGELWKRRIAEQKVRKDKRKIEKKQNKTKKPDLDDKKVHDEESSKSTATKNSGLTLDHFYGDKTKSAKPLEAGLTEDVQEDTEDMLSAIKRRRKAAEERKQKESEERLIKQKEKSEMQQQKEDMLFENQFKKGVALAKSVLRHSPIGLDRHHNRYWILHTSQPGLYVEKGWASRESDYTVQLDVSSSSESDSDGRSTESGIQSGSSDLNKDSTCEKTVPPVGQNLWFMFDSVEDVTMLVDGLHPLGVRESALKEALKKHIDSLINGLKLSSAKVVENGNKDNENKDGNALFEGLQEEMRDLELRLVHGGLGSVSDLATWEKKLSEAREIKDFVECLIDIQIHVLPKFIKGLLASQASTRKKNPVDSKDEIKSEENEEKVEVKRKDVDGAKVWLDALQHCGTFSRLHVLMGILESCIKWEKSAENMCLMHKASTDGTPRPSHNRVIIKKISPLIQKCRICRKKGDDEYLLLCDECNMPFHLFCLRPVLAEVPVGEWYCAACSPERASQKSRLRFRRTKEEDESEDEDEGIADIEHEQECAICGEDSDLIQCSTCPSSFHMDCHEPPLRHMPRMNTWKCMQCKTGVRLRKSRRRQAQKRKHYIDYITDEDELEDIVPTKKLQKATTISDLRRNETPEPRDTRRRSQDDDLATSRPARLMDRESKRTMVSKTKETNKAQDLERGSGAVSKANSKSNAAKNDEESSRVGRRGDVKTTQKSTTSKDAVNKQAILDLIDRLRKHRNSWPFLEPVDVVDAPDYYSIIVNPIDLRTMEDKCISDVYSSPSEFVSDFRLMLQNAERYNEVESPVGKCMAPLDKFFESIVNRYIPNCQYQSRKWFSGRL